RTRWTREAPLQGDPGWSQGAAREHRRAPSYGRRPCRWIGAFMKHPSGPPRLAVAMLELLLPAESRDAVIGDLVEAHERRNRGGLLAAMHFWREALSALT